ncbi:uncharacterized protein LOC115630206 [Scaptodrosophila lebanonensis]|uniref:Uncharacterized protein LOC115630206 n=1 Tax=Drosophila lebanonensis TaxID=7225 RepID=A0A6J2U2L9_DROLE|nr:uncharacterized protein LOC115630206 [Scaptodrosophila lebanonensis]
MDLASLMIYIFTYIFGRFLKGPPEQLGRAYLKPLSVDMEHRESSYKWHQVAHNKYFRPQNFTGDFESSEVHNPYTAELVNDTSGEDVEESHLEDWKTILQENALILRDEVTSLVKMRVSKVAVFRRLIHSLFKYFRDILLPSDIFYIICSTIIPCQYVFKWFGELRNYVTGRVGQEVPQQTQTYSTPKVSSIRTSSAIEEEHRYREILAQLSLIANQEVLQQSATNLSPVVAPLAEEHIRTVTVISPAMGQEEEQELPAQLSLRDNQELQQQTDTSRPLSDHGENKTDHLERCRGKSEEQKAIFWLNDGRMYVVDCQEVGDDLVTEDP